MTAIRKFAGRLMLLLALPVLLAMGAAQVQAGVPPRSPDLEEVSSLIARGTDEMRTAQGSAPLAVAPQLRQAAQEFALFMARTDQYGHRADGSTPAARVQRQGYAYCLVAENIAYRYSSAGFDADELARRFVEGWRDSPGHRKNMLDANATEAGMSVARSERTGRYYAVQLFGRPATAMFAFQISNETAAPVRYRLGERSFDLPVRGVRSHKQCRSDRLVVQGVSDTDAASVQPGDGDRLAITRDRLGLRLLRQ